MTNIMCLCLMMMFRVMQTDMRETNYAVGTTDPEYNQVGGHACIGSCVVPIYNMFTSSSYHDVCGCWYQDVIDKEA
jgi:hypothetical protein